MNLIFQCEKCLDVLIDEGAVATIIIGFDVFLSLKQNVSSTQIIDEENILKCGGCRHCIGFIDFSKGLMLLLSSLVFD